MLEKIQKLEKSYTPEYIARLAADPNLPRVKVSGSICVTNDGVSTVSANHRIAVEILDTVKIYGQYWFLHEIGIKIGLISILQCIFRNDWQEIFALACYLIISDKPTMYCEDWISESEVPDVGSMSSQRISDLLASFGEHERNVFYKSWHQHVKEREYIALDITSISSYSKQRSDCERGYNRDGDKLPQINICMLFSETSRLPVYQTNYSGSLGDVSTLECTIKKFQAILGEFEYSFIMDKGFCSIKNVNMLLEKGVSFLVSVPFSNSFAKNQVDSQRKNIDQVENTILTSSSPVRGIHKVRSWGNKGKKIHTHIFFDPVKALKKRNELFALVKTLKNHVISGSGDEYKKEIDKYLIVRKSGKEENGYAVNIRQDVVDEALKTSGWLVLISDHIDDPQRAHELYRAKDVVEKGFWKYKNSLGIERLRVHSDERADNKSFIAFISLTLSSYINNTMKDLQLYDQMTFDKLLLILAKMKSSTVNGIRIFRPLTKQQKDLLKAFDMKLPVG